MPLQREPSAYECGFNLWIAAAIWEATSSSQFKVLYRMMVHGTIGTQVFHLFKDKHKHVIFDPKKHILESWIGNPLKTNCQAFRSSWKCSFFCSGQFSCLSLRTQPFTIISIVCSCIHLCFYSDYSHPTIQLKVNVINLFCALQGYSSRTIFFKVCHCKTKKLCLSLLGILLCVRS